MTEQRRCCATCKTPFQGLSIHTTTQQHLSGLNSELMRSVIFYIAAYSSSSYSIILLQVHFRAVQSNKSHPPRFLGSEDITNFFSRAQRSRIVFEILCTTPFGREKKGEVGVRSLVDQGAFSAAFPLHDVSSFIQVPPPMLVTYIFPGGL